MKHYGLIGEKLGHSVSVPIHQAIWAEIGVEADYRLIEIERSALAENVQTLLNTLDGFNVTVPYKQAVMPLLHRIDPFAQAVGAVNTVLTGSESCGFNTDDPGFEQMLRHFDMEVSGQRVFILGSGGAMHACRSAVRRMGAKQVSIVSRTPKEPDEISYEAFYDSFPDVGGLIVNTTPVGMYPHGDTCPIDRARLPLLVSRASAVADIIFNPAETMLTAAARAAGTPTCTGLYMLVAQAVEAEKIWQEREMPHGLCEKLMKELHLL